MTPPAPPPEEEAVMVLYPNPFRGGPKPDCYGGNGYCARHEQHVSECENDVLRARVAALEYETERLTVQLEGTKRVRLRTEELVREVDAERARVAALETECAGHKEAFARMLAEAELCGSANDELRERIAALEAALREFLRLTDGAWFAAIGSESSAILRAALARHTPTPPRHLSFCASLQRSDWPCDCEPPMPGEGAGR